MVHRLAPSRNCSEFRTMQLGLHSRRRGDPMWSHYCTSCICCQSGSGSHTIWQFWRTKSGARPLQFTCTTESLNVSAAELYAHLPSRSPQLSNRSPGQTFPGVLSDFDFKRRLSGTRCHKQYSSATLCLFLNLDLKLFCSIRLSLNTDPTCRQHPLRPYGAIEILLLLLFSRLTMETKDRINSQMSRLEHDQSPNQLPQNENCETEWSTMFVCLLGV